MRIQHTRGQLQPDIAHPPSGMAEAPVEMLPELDHFKSVGSTIDRVLMACLPDTLGSATLSSRERSHMLPASEPKRLNSSPPAILVSRGAANPSPGNKRLRRKDQDEGTFDVSVVYDVSFIREGKDISFAAKNRETGEVKTWKTQLLEDQDLEPGWIGFRTMGTQGGRYKDFKVFAPKAE